MNKTALVVVDVQRDFCERGSLAVTGGAKVATKIRLWIESHGHEYERIVFTKDWHTPGSDNGGHFAMGEDQPDYADTWPHHCVAGSEGSEIHPNLGLPIELLDRSFIVYKGQDAPAYSGFEAVTAPAGEGLHWILSSVGITDLDVCGIATDYCVKATALDGRKHGYAVNVMVDMTAGVAEDTTHAALHEMDAAGVKILTAAVSS